MDQQLEPIGEFTDDKIKMSIAGHSMQGIARALQLSVRDVEETLTEWSREYMPPDLRRHRLAINLARIEQAIQILHPRVLQGELKAIKIFNDLIRRQSVMLGLHAPREAVLRIVEESRSRPHDHDRLQAALEEFAPGGPKAVAPPADHDADAETADAAG